MNSQEYVDYISHTGTVVAVDTRQGTVTVALDSAADCGGCPASKLCHAAGEKPSTLTVPSKIAGAFQPGDTVKLVGTETMHRRAIMIATVVPSVLLIAVMVGIFLLTANQLAACLSGLGAMILFFTALYLFRNRIAHEFTFTIRKA